VSLLLRLGHGVELAGGVPDGWLPPGLGEAHGRELAEWHALARAGDGPARDVLLARAEQLADEIAAATGTAVLVVDGDVVHEHLPPGPAEPEPTPWGTGTVLAGASAALVLVGFLALHAGLARLSSLLAVGVLAVVVVLLIPTGLRYRAVPVWRWVVHGAAAGVTLGWAWLLLTALT
jgi:hypothetical protein